MNINFYWKGDDFQYLNRLTLLSHVLVGHTPIIWLDGAIPKSKYWISDIPEIKIKNARTILKNVNNGNSRVYSTLFSYHIVKATGEYYADTDAIAIKPWPDQDTVLATYDKSVIAVGVIRLPKDHAILNECINTFVNVWGNVHKFTKVIKSNNMSYNVPINMFYPVHCGNNMSKTINGKGKMFDNINLPDDCVSYHYYSNSVSKLDVTHEWVDKVELKDSLFVRLSKLIFEKYTYTNKG